MTTDLKDTNLLRRQPGDSDSRAPCVESQSIIGIDDVAVESPIILEQPQVPSKDEASAIPDQTCSIVDEEIIRTVTTTADTIAPVLADLPCSLRKRTEAWCELHGFNTDDGLPETTLARQAVYYILLKITLYEWYHQFGPLPELPENTRDGLRAARTQIDNPAFAECVLDEVIWLAGESAVEGVVETRDRLLESTQPAEDIGALYEAILSKEERRPLGQVRTPPRVGKTMRTWAASGDDVILDPGLGAGGLSTPFHPRWELNTDPDHINGVDRSPLSLLMGSTALTLARQSHDPYTADFLSLSPRDLSRDVDAVVCNPPYTRHHALPSDYKESINAQAEQETGLEISTATPLYAYFIYHARQVLTRGDRAAFLIPPNFLAADYGDALKRFILAEFDIKALLLLDPDDGPVFDGALTTALIAFLEVPDESDVSDTRFVHVDGQLDEISIQEIIRDGQQGQRDWGFVNCVPQESLTAAENWKPLFEPLSLDTSMLTPFSEIAEIHRGIMTGENDFFTFTQTDIDKVGIEERYLSKIVPSPRIVRGFDFRHDDWERHQDHEEAVWLLYHLDAVDGVPQTVDAAETGYSAEDTLAPEAAPSPALVEYLQTGLVAHPTLTSRNTIRTRSPWYRVDRREPPQILIPYMYRSGFRALLNETDARYVNNYTGIYPDTSISRTQVKALLAYLNSSMADEVVRRDARPYAGMDKLEPGDLADVPVLDPRSITEETVTALANQFDELRQTARQNGSRTTVINRIDAILEQEL
ncbi:Eco57I restriction-modification methylase domain-containing protein [Halopenitus sp. H-Gu1]|uniref:Eco57I restriction-modification methylase domain-containing protein n=1 Tax=Halopenitus sp. H-Gu1 TaxID=3242697 RepID=UPI00359CEE9C